MDVRPQLVLKRWPCFLLFQTMMITKTGVLKETYMVLAETSQYKRMDGQTDSNRSYNRPPQRVKDRKAERQTDNGEVILLRQLAYIDNTTTTK